MLPFNPLVLKMRKSPTIHAKGLMKQIAVGVCSFKNLKRYDDLATKSNEENWDLSEDKKWSLHGKMNTSWVFRKWAVKAKNLVCFLGSWYIYHWIKPSGKKQQKKRTPPAFLFLYILMSPDSNISHWKGACMQTSSFSFINDDLQIKPFGARSWQFPKQPVKS